MNGYGDVGHPDDAPADHHNQHGNRGFSSAAENSRDTVGKCQKKIEQSHRAGLGRSIYDNLRIIVKGGDEQGREGIDENADELCSDDGAENAKAGSLFRPLILSGAEILAHERGKGHGKAGDRQESEAFDLRIGAASRHRHFPETVDIGLDYHVSQRYNGVLETGRETVCDDLPQESCVKPDFL